MGNANPNPLNAKNTTIEIKNALALPREKFEINITISEKTNSGTKVAVYPKKVFKISDSENSPKREITRASNMVKIKIAPKNVAQASTFDKYTLNLDTGRVSVNFIVLLENSPLNISIAINAVNNGIIVYSNIGSTKREKLPVNSMPIPAIPFIPVKMSAITEIMAMLKILATKIFFFFEILNISFMYAALRADIRTHLA